MLDELVSRVLDLPVDRAYDEAQTKLVGTIMIFSGKLATIGSINREEGIRYHLGDRWRNCPPENVKQLDCWLPQTGVYFTNKGLPVYLARIANRQWKRSFNQELYTIHWLQEDGRIYDVDINSRHTFWISRQGEVWYLNTKIGYVKNSKNITCVKPMYSQELKDWLRSNQI